jgi:ABC-type nitrate/sulfonate/bicarbonate transport system substrate-binding protein
MQNPNIFKSRKFWLMIADVALANVVFFVTKYAAPELAKDILWLIASWQPVVVFLIAAIAYEDGAAMKAGLRQ